MSEHILTVMVCRCKCRQSLTARVRYQAAPDLQKAHLLFVRYYAAAPDQQLSTKWREQDLEFSHLVWEESAQQVWDSHASVLCCGAW